jgi:AbrB family looped-hinge helix DNA binding protein
MRITSKGQVTIPLFVREHLGLMPQSEVEFEIDGETVRIRKARGQRRGDALIAHLRGRGNKRMTTDAIMALTRGD